MRARGLAGVSTEEKQDLAVGLELAGEGDGRKRLDGQSDSQEEKEEQLNYIPKRTGPRREGRDRTGTVSERRPRLKALEDTAVRHQ